MGPLTSTFNINMKFFFIKLQNVCSKHDKQSTNNLLHWFKYFPILSWNLICFAECKNSNVIKKMLNEFVGILLYFK